MTDRAITTEVKGTFLAVTDADRRAAKTIRLLLPYGSLLDDDDALALAVFSRMHDLDCFNGESYFMVREKTDKNTGEVTIEKKGVYPGVKGKRKWAKRQMKAIDPQGHYRIEYSIVDPKTLGINPDDCIVAVKGELRDSNSMGRYIVDSLNLAKAGYTKDEIEKVIGRAPIVVGYGYVTKKEAYYIKQTPLQLARKRTENDCLTQKFDLPFSNEVAEDIMPDMTNGVPEEPGEYIDMQLPDPSVTEGEFATIPDADPEPEITPEERKEREAAILGQLGFEV